MTEGRFSILIADARSVGRYMTDGYSLFHEVVLYPTTNQLSEYFLFFRGIIRSAWHEVTQNISVVCDTEEFYYPMMEELRQVMIDEEGIEFALSDREDGIP